MRNEHFAKVAYHAYGATTDYKNYRGEPMPAWSDLTGTIQQAWRAAAEAVIEDLIRGIRTLPADAASHVG